MKKEDADYNISSRCDEEYQKAWRELVQKEKDFAVQIIEHDKIFGSLIKIWAEITETILDLAIDRFAKKNSINTLKKFKN